jgi:hypothetical protein
MKRLLAAFSGVILISGFLGTLLQPVVFGQNSNGYIISPVREELTIEKGQSQTVTLTVTNATELDTEARVVINDFEPSDNESGEPKILLDGETSSGNSFKTLVGEMPNITLGPKESKDFDVTVSVPVDAAPGGYYGAVRLATNTGETDSQVALAASVATIFLIKVPGEITEDLQLVEFTAAKNGSTGRFFINAGEMSIITRLKNNGNIHVAPYGKVIIRDGSGQIVQEYEFNDSTPRNNVLPNSIRKFEDKLQNQKWVGKYTISANLGYGTTGGLITAENTFWVIPLWFVIIVSIIILAIIVGAYLIYRRYKLHSHKSPTRRYHG